LPRAEFPLWARQVERGLAQGQDAGKMSVRFANCQPKCPQWRGKAAPLWVCQNRLSGKGRLVGEAADERQSALLSTRSRALSKAAAKFWRVWSALEQVKPFDGGQIVAAFRRRR